MPFRHAVHSVHPAHREKRGAQFSIALRRMGETPVDLANLVCEARTAARKPESLKLFYLGHVYAAPLCCLGFAPFPSDMA